MLFFWTFNHQRILKKISFHKTIKQQNCFQHIRNVGHIVYLKVQEDILKKILILAW